MLTVVDSMDVWKSHECVGCNLKPIQSTGDTSATSNAHTCHHDDKTNMLNMHKRRPQWNGSWFCVQATLLVMSIIMLWIIIFFPRFHLPLLRFQHHFLESSFSGLLAWIYPDMTVNRTAPSTPVTAAFSSNGRTDMVQWDKYTLALQGQRVLV